MRDKTPSLLNKYRPLPMGRYDCGLAGIRIPEPRLPEPEPRKHGDTEPLRVPMFDLGDLATPPKKKEKPS